MKDGLFAFFFVGALFACTALHALPPATPPITPVPLPLLVVMDESAAFSWQEACSTAASLWGDRLAVYGGILPLPISDTGGTVSVYVHEFLPRVERDHEMLGWVRDEWRRGCTERIYLSERAPLDLRVRVCAHEIGHALGLAHVSDPKSVMYEYCAPGEFDMPKDFDRMPRRIACPRETALHWRP